MTIDALTRPVWGMLIGEQAHLTVVRGAAVRIDPDFGPFAAARDTGEEAQTALATIIVERGEAWLVESHEWPAPPGTRVVRTAPLVQMVAQSPVPPRRGDGDPVLLGDADIPEMTALALATEPGPWAARTAHYGAFYGMHGNGRLMAMAGQRMRPGGGFAEVSAVCTWPEFQGQGLAGMLIRRVMADMTARGETPFLHSYAGNAHAIRLYESLGFSVAREMVATVLDRA